MVMHLQSLDLFRSCAATEAVRLAQIARPVQLAEGDVVYRPMEPAEMLYSVVEGRVVVEDSDGARREVGPGNAFGVLEVLSGRQRSSRAEALAASLVLAIAEEDFFDLLSNNIDIVKALFREVLEESMSNPVANGTAEEPIAGSATRIAVGSSFAMNGASESAGADEATALEGA